MLGDLFDSPWKVLIVAVVLIVLFGSKKLPDAARSLGKSMRILKAEVADLHNDDPAAEAAKAAAAQAAAAQAAAAQAAAEAPPSPVLQHQLQIEQLQRQLSDLQKSSANGAAMPADAPLTETQRTQQPS
jgi:sec-independent protein translocase protein TatA